MTKLSKSMIGVSLVAGVVLGGCGGATSKSTGQLPTEGATSIEQQVNQYLSEKNITLPAGVSRANLAPLGGIVGSGVVTLEKKYGNSTYSVICDLPELTGGHYEAWLKQADGSVVTMGQLLLEKGGYIVEYNTTKDLSAFNQVVVSQEMKTVIGPTTIVLQGNF